MLTAFIGIQSIKADNAPMPFYCKSSLLKMWCVVLGKP